MSSATRRVALGIAAPAPESAATTLQVAEPPRADTARYDGTRAADAAEEADHA